ncbi:MAG TPA: ABC transporter permease [Candidatus Limiplasma sp.]|nr:ABC transporter permease [Candidatus Limiplasma sp.]
MLKFQVFLSCIHIKRQLPKNILVFVVCAAMVFFLCSYASSIKANQEQLNSLPEVLPVSGFISNLNGSRNLGLLISGSMVDSLEASGFLKDILYTTRMPATYAVNETEKPKIVYLMGFNTLKPYPSIQPDNLKDSEEFFKSQNAQCIASRRFLAQYHLSIGDLVKLDLHRYQFGEVPGQMTYEHLAQRTLTIADSFDSNAVTTDLIQLPDVLFPIGWAKKTFTECDSPFYYDSVSFRIKDPAKMNDAKAFMKAQGLLSVNPQASDSVSGSAAVINDETFIRSATSIQNNLTLLWMFLPALTAAILLASAVMAHLMMHSRRGEFAVMRSLGMPKQACLRVYLMESMLVAFPGGIVGMAAALFFTALPFSASMAVLAVFYVFYLLGAFIAVRMLSRVSVAAMLSAVD